MRQTSLAATGHRGRLLVLLCLVALLVPAQAAAARASSTLTVTSTAAPADEDVAVALTLVDATGAPVAGASVSVERRVAGVWEPLATVVLDSAGQGSTPLRLSRVAADNVVRASYAGDATHPPAVSPDVLVPLVRRSSRLTLWAPRRVVDERSIAVRLRWRTRRGTPVEGAVTVQERAGERWRTVARVVTGPDGTATVPLRPRTDLRLRARAAALDWVEGNTSAGRQVDNLPPAPPVRTGGPAPRIMLPPQPRPDTSGPAAAVTPIPDAVWRSMVGRSWHPGCPVGRDGLRLVRINYYDFDGYRRRGELVIAASAARQAVGALSELHRRRLPIRSMYRVDRFGWSRHLRGADDYRSMAAGNTSAFNCRQVVGRPGVRSPHSWGRSLDINPWENPYRVNGRWLPNAWWATRSHPRVAWRSHRHAVLQVMRRHGFAWTYGHRDAHHFDARTPTGRVLARCASVCH